MNTKLIANTNPKLLTSAANRFSPFPANTYFTIEEIRLRVETVTPLLMEIKDYRRPERRGIND
jgi:hypothetical protein